MPSKTVPATRSTPPTMIDRSESLGSAPATKACASTTLRTAPRPARSARMRSHAAPTTAWCAPGAGQRNSRVVGVEVRDAVDRCPHAVAALEQDRQVERAEVGDHADAVAEERGPVAEADGRVMVARRHDD